MLIALVITIIYVIINYFIINNTMILIEPQINFYYLYSNDNKNNTSFKSEELIQQNSALRQTIDVLERENNLLKSLIFINSLTSNNNLSNRIYNVIEQ